MDAAHPVTQVEPKLMPPRASYEFAALCRILEYELEVRPLLASVRESKGKIKAIRDRYREIFLDSMYIKPGMQHVLEGLAKTMARNKEKHCNLFGNRKMQRSYEMVIFAAKRKTVLELVRTRESMPRASEPDSDTTRSDDEDYGFLSNNTIWMH